MTKFFQKQIRIYGAIFTLTALFSLAPVPVRADDFRVEANNSVIDQAGRRILVPKPFKRIISLYGAHTENLFGLGLDTEIIGVSKNAVYPPEALNKDLFSYHDDPEKFLAARPDMVLVRPMIDRGYPQLISRLEKSGITVVSLQPGNTEEMYVYWEILGILTGKQAMASEMITRFKAAVSDFKSLAKTVDRKKNVYFEAIHSKMKTFSQGSMAVFALETAGGINIAHDARPVRGTNIAAYGKERILSHADDIDVYLAQSGSMNRPSISMIKHESGFKVIKAVMENQIYFVDEMIVSRPTFRLLDGIYEIGRILYPEVFYPNAIGILEKAYTYRGLSLKD
ncbi:MAG: ABC transporter substrate-binding protein [Proteobacteria bacterium]|nr:ABC transporter substrate-binding protein [Pseudomonadota bacterium]